jgi:hypothetical protein
LLASDERGMTDLEFKNLSFVGLSDGNVGLSLISKGPGFGVDLI